MVARTPGTRAPSARFAGTSPAGGGGGDLFARAPRHQGDKLAAEVCRRVFLPPERVRVSEWAARHRTITTGAGAGSKYDPSVTPYAVFPMDLLTDPRVSQITLPWGTQLGKSEIVINAMEYTLGVLAQPFAHIMPGQDRVRDEAKDRILPSIEACEPLAAMMTGRDEDETSRRVKFLNGAVLSLHSSAALSDLIGRSFPKGACDEVSSSRFDHAAVLELEERRKAWSPAEHKLYLISNQAAEGTGIDHYARGSATVMHFRVPCPHCGTYQRLVFDRGETGLAWERGEEGLSRPERADLAEATAHYRCASALCRQTAPHLGRIENFDKPWMLAMGVWVAEDEEIESDGRVLATRGMSARERWAASLARKTYDEMRAEGEEAPSVREDPDISPAGGGGESGAEDGRRDVAPTDPRHGVRVVGGSGLGRSVCLNLSSLYSPFPGASFGQMAAKFMRAGRMTEKFCTDWLGEPWRTPGRRLEPDQLRARFLPSDHERGYELGTVPDWAMALTMAADVQQDRCWVNVRAWGERGLRTALVWAGEVPSRIGRNLAELDALLGWTFPVWKRPDLPAMRIKGFAADSGQGLRKNEVYAWSQRLSALFAREPESTRRHARSVKGDAGTGMEHLSELKVLLETRHQGEKTSLRRGVPHMRVNTPLGKSLFMAALGLAVEAAAEGLGDEGVGAGLREYFFPAPWDAAARDPHLTGGTRMSVTDYLAQITAEEFAVVQTRADAAPKGAWRKVREDNHQLDCEVYQIAYAHAYRVHRLAGRASPETPKRARSARAPGPADAGAILRGRA